MKMPVLFVGHGSPLNAIEENSFTRALREVRKKLPKPKAVCVVSARWVTSGCHMLDVDGQKQSTISTVPRVPFMKCAQD